MTPTVSSLDSSARPARAQFLPFHVPRITEDEISAVVECLRSGWLTTGAKTRAFEEAFRAVVGSPHAIAVNSATAALHLALEAVGVQPGDEVIVPTMTFAATAEVVAYFRARPVLVDCDCATLNIEPDLIERAITPRTKAIIPVHFAGQPCDMDRILEIGRHHALPIIEDAAHALPAYHHDRLVGTIGDITCFSFYATKTITTGEGGMITTANDAYAERMRIMSLHGISKDAWKRYTSEGSWYYEILYPGYKYNLTDLASSLGIEQLKKHAAFWQERQHISQRYDRGLADVQELSTPTIAAGRTHSWHLYVIQLQLERLTIDRATFIESLKAERIGSSVHFIPLHLHPYYRSTFGYTEADFPTASAVYKRTVSLPIYPGMTDDDVDDVIAAVRRIVERARR